MARELAALPPSLGRTRLIGVDGHAGSGKSTFAGHLARALAALPEPPAHGVEVFHVDEISSHAELFGWAGRLRAEVLEPLAEARDALWRPYDWHAGARGPARVLPAASVVLLEGVGAGRRELRPALAGLVWMETARELSWGRGRERDGSALSAFWDGWERAERAHFADDPSRPFADLVVRQGGAGYEWTRVADGSPVEGRSVTRSEGLRDA
ncbi:uridine kinase family protein [Streptomyces sp. BI20]|uniref:uridine kinase family protein n=1 Tax=Streptomyces sp. BI20 TaxID=3403460 RepID=UPI003C70A4B8